METLKKKRQNKLNSFLRRRRRGVIIKYSKKPGDSSVNGAPLAGGARGHLADPLLGRTNPLSPGLLE